MFGFKAFSEAPISAEVEAQATVIENVGAIGASAIGVNAIGRATTQTTTVAGTSATASASIPAITVSSPAPTATVSVTGSASVPAITLTSPAPTVTVSSTASATAATITVTSPAPTVSAGVTASAASSTVTVTSPAPTATSSATATVSDLSSDDVTTTFTPPVSIDFSEVNDSFSSDTRITRTVDLSDSSISDVTIYPGLTNSLPASTSITVSATQAGSSADAGTYQIPSVASAYVSGYHLVNWDQKWIFNAVKAKRTSGSNPDSTNKTHFMIHTFNDAGQLTLHKFYRLTDTVSNDAGYTGFQRTFIDGSVSVHPAIPTGNGRYHIIRPYFYTVSANSTSTIGVQIHTIHGYDSPYPTISKYLTTANTGFSLGNLSYNNGTVVNVSSWSGYALPWRGDWGSRSRQNYYVVSYQETPSTVTSYYLKLLAENGDVISVNQTTSASDHATEADKFTDGTTYPNLILGLGNIDTFDNDDLRLEARAKSNRSYPFYNTYGVQDNARTVTADIDADVNRTASLALTVSAPQPALASNAIATASPGTVSLSAPSPTLSVSSTASAALITVSVTAPTVTATSTASATASASIPSITVGVPLVNETVVEIPLPTPAISVSSPAPQATSTSTASATVPSVTVTTPQVSATSASTASATVPAITVTSPAPTVSASATVSLDLHKATQTFTVTVQSTYYGNKYYIDGVQQASLSLHEEGTYRFDLSDSSVSNHPLRFSTTSNGTHNSGTQYTTGVTVVGTAGSSGAYVEIVVTSSTPDLYYYCTNHSGMGGSIAFSSDFTQVPFILSVSSAAPTLSVGSIGEAQAASVALTAAEATATGAAEATFADSIEVGVVSPAPTPTVIALPSIPSITVTVPTVSATGSTSVTASASLPTITVTSPASSATSDTQTDDVDGSSTATGSSVLVKKGEASVTGTATASSNEAFRAKGAGSLAGQATVSGSSTLLKVGSSSVAGSTNASASCTIVKDASSTISTTSTSSGTALSLFNGDGSLATDSTASGTAGFQLGAFGDINGTAEVSALSFVLNPIDVNSLTPSNIVRINFEFRFRWIYDGRQSRSSEIFAGPSRVIGIYK